MNKAMNVIVICPCCATPKDVTASDPVYGDEQHFVCVACDQKWSMVVDAERFKENALT
jgi:transposase-like protein